MEWPFRRFVKAFDAFQRRVLCDEWRNRKIAHIAALYANMNYDGSKEDENPRAKLLPELERAYDKLIADIWNGTVGESSEAEEAAWESDFMRAGRRALGVALTPPRLPGEEAIGALPA